MTREAESKSDAEKLACFERVLEIMRDRLALEVHMRKRKATFQEILYAREDAYTNLVNAVLGPDAIEEAEEAEAPQARQRTAPRTKKNGSGKRA